MLEITKRPYGEVLLISLKGEIDVMAANDIKVFFQEARVDKSRHYLINFENVEKLNYSVVQNINGPITDLMTVGEVSVCGIPSSMERMLKNTAFYTKANIYSDKKEALAAILG